MSCIAGRFLYEGLMVTNQFFKDEREAPLRRDPHFYAREVFKWLKFDT